MNEYEMDEFLEELTDEFSDEFESEFEDEFEYESDEEIGRRLRPSSRSTRRSSQRPPRRPRSGRPFPRPRPRPPLRPGRPGHRPHQRPVFDRASTPCVCPAHGTEFVRWVQSSLNRLLGANLPVNGIMNRAARAALRRFQQQQSLPADGIAGPDTERALLDAKAGGTGSTAPSSSAAQTAEFEFDFEDPEWEWENEVNRSSRDYIVWVQASLNRVLGTRLATDGISGPLTRSAVRSFQARNRLAVDGIVGPVTEAALIRAGAGQPPGAGTAPSAPRGGTPRSGSKVELVEIEPGKQVARQIEPNVRGLLAAARQAGFSLSIRSGYRSPDEQIALRRQNCGPTHFDIFEKDSKLCSPQTAKPGTSNHEKGLAVDLDWNTGGRSKSWSDPEAVWLRQNAKARFGLDNKIQSEPWHWSINGY